MPHVDIRISWECLPEIDSEQHEGCRAIPLVMRAVHMDSTCYVERVLELDPKLAAAYPGGIEALARDDVVAMQADGVADLLRFMRDKAVI